MIRIPSRRWPLPLGPLTPYPFLTAFFHHPHRPNPGALLLHDHALLSLLLTHLAVSPDKLTIHTCLSSHPKTYPTTNHAPTDDEPLKQQCSSGHLSHHPQ